MTGRLLRKAGWKFCFVLKRISFIAAVVFGSVAVCGILTLMFLSCALLFSEQPPTDIFSSENYVILGALVWLGIGALVFSRYVGDVYHELVCSSALSRPQDTKVFERLVCDRSFTDGEVERIFRSLCLQWVPGNVEHFTALKKMLASLHRHRFDVWFKVTSHDFPSFANLAMRLG